MKILFVDCCLRPESISRTYQICNEFIEEYKRCHPLDQIVTRTLKNEKLRQLTYEDLERRDALIYTAEWENAIFQYAREFAEADKIIIGAPYWDLSFPALLKIYLENVFVGGVTYQYGEAGLAGLCKAEKLLYITTAGGFFGENDFGTDYLQGVCKMFGIIDFETVKVEGLDIQGIDKAAILADALGSVRKTAGRW